MVASRKEVLQAVRRSWQKGQRPRQLLHDAGDTTQEILETYPLIKGHVARFPKMTRKGEMCVVVVVVFGGGAGTGN